MSGETVVLTGSSAPPTIKPFEALLTVKMGEKVSVLCGINSGTPPFKIEWIKEGQVLRPDDNVKIKGDEEDSALIIKAARESDAGNYSCSAKNAFGSDWFTTQIVIKGKSRMQLTVICF